MKCLFLAAMVVIVSHSHLSGATGYQSLCTTISGLGQSIENADNIPVIGKLTSLLPFAVLAASLKECPIQTMVVLTSVGAYILSQNEAVREMMNTYEVMDNFPWIKRNNTLDTERIDESIFVFDGDEEVNEETEDNLLNSDLLDDESNDLKTTKKRKSTRTRL